MILYHGTNYGSLIQIQKKGLLSKIHHGKSNWDRTVPSNPKFIYLTNAYGLFYAQEAAKRKEDFPVLIKIDTLNATLYPDDNFIGQVLWRQMTNELRNTFNGGLIEFTKTMIDIENYQRYFSESLRQMGNCAVKRLKSSNSLIQAAVIRNKNLAFKMGGDPIICPVNYQLLSHFYCPLMQFFFGECDFPIMFSELNQSGAIEKTKFEDWKIELINF